MINIFSSEQDTTNFEISDRPLEINSCGMNRVSHRGNATFVRRPAGRRDFQLLYLSQGRADHYWQGQWITLHAGQAFLYWPGMPQYYLYRADTPVICKWVHFSGTAAEKLLRDCGMRPEAPVMEIGDDAEISLLYDRLIREAQLKPPCYQALSQALLYQIVALMGRKMAILQDEAGYQLRQKLMRAVEYMHSHYGDPQSLDAYAAQCGMSRFRFAHAFRLHMGQSPYAYLTRLRLEHARELLAGSDLKIADVARACGYENPLYFSRLFSQRFQLSPTRYRRESQAKELPPDADF